MQSIPSAFTPSHLDVSLNRVSKQFPQKVSSPVLSHHFPLVDRFISLHFGADEEKPTLGSGDEPGAEIPKPSPIEPTLTASTPEKGIDKLKNVFAGTVFEEDDQASLLKYVEAAAKAKKKYPPKNKPPIIVFTSPLAMGAGKSSMLALFPFLTKKMKEAGEKNPPIPKSSFETILKNIVKKEPPKTSLNPVKALDEIDAEMSKPVIGSDADIPLLGGKFSTTLPPGMSVASAVPVSEKHDAVLKFYKKIETDIGKLKGAYVSFSLLDTSQPLPPAVEALRTGLLNGQDVSQVFIQAMPDLLLNQPLNVIHRLSKAVETFFDMNYRSQKNHANEAELLLLLNHPELWDRDPKKTKQITEALTS
ncbi:MAG: hypothetical protein K2X66_09490, partial [Cyanobacteria bacterium]|nr:hypothetical protein [Cyanobacteriota bacterium]